MSSFQVSKVVNEEDYTLIDWDDGHLPGGSSKNNNNNNSTTKMAINHNKAASNFFSIIDEFLPELWLNRVYKYAVERGRPWGAYVTTTELDDDNLCPEALWKEGSPTSREKAISLLANRTYFNKVGTECLQQDKGRIHGVAVWCLTSGVSNEVQYHIDYAELYRYETNVIHPPLYAGTCQISPLEGTEMIGGDFYANLGGLDHYKIYGYKAAFKGEDNLKEDVETSGDWLRVRYKANRGTLHDGDYPHFSSPVRKLVDGKRRVILGFNFFSDAVGECCIRAPEHSDAFNRTVKLYQMMSKLGSSPTVMNEEEQKEKSCAIDRKSKKGISAKDIAKNPAMAKMFILAAKKYKAVQEREKLQGQDERKENAPK